MTVWTVPATVIRWIDADTAECALDLGFAISYRAKVRLEHCNAPEIATPAGKQALAWAVALVPPGTVVTVQSRRWEKYGRVLGVIVLPDGRDFSTELVAAGHAVPYEGGPR